MATARPIQIDQNPVTSLPARVTVTFDLAAGEEDTGPLSLVLKAPDGSVAARLDGIMIKGYPAETTPEVVIGNVEDRWSLSCVGGGTLASLGDNKFSLGR